MRCLFVIIISSPTGQAGIRRESYLCYDLLDVGRYYLFVPTGPIISVLLLIRDDKDRHLPCLLSLLGSAATSHWNLRLHPVVLFTQGTVFADDGSEAA